MKQITKRSTVIAVAVIAWFTSFWISGQSLYDLQLLLSSVTRAALLFAVVWAYYDLRLYDDDVEADWGRINDGNIAVAIYRAAEFGVVVGAVSLFLYKI